MLPDVKPCAVCGVIMRKVDDRSRWNTRKYCSLRCAGVAKRAPAQMKPCVICGKPIERQPRTGDERWAKPKVCSRRCQGMLHRRDPMVRLEANRSIDAATDCWNWNGTLADTGYGCISVDGRQRHTHRVSYELHIGPVAAGLEIDHLCFNRACFNPAHLEAVLPAINKRRAAARRSGE